MQTPCPDQQLSSDCSLQDYEKEISVVSEAAGLLYFIMEAQRHGGHLPISRSLM